MSGKIQQQLAELYPEDAARAAYESLCARMALAQSRIPAAERETLFAPEDVVLITYGGSLREAGQMPLQSLHQFTAAHLKGIISAIHILPFFPYSSDDGFSVKDFYEVDPELGNWEQIHALGQNFRLMFDAVFNHMSAQSEWFLRYLAGDPEFAGLFRSESPDADLSSVTRPRVSPLLTPFERPNGETVHVWTTFSADQVDFDARDPHTLLRLIDILLFYVENGASMIRLDAIAFLWKEAGTRSIHLPQTHLIIQIMRSVLDEVAPHVVIITETNVPHWENIAYWGDGYNEAQMVYNFTLPPLLLHSMIQANSAPLRDWVNTLTSPSERSSFFNFTASHDGIGLRPVEGLLSEEALQGLIDHTLARGGRVSYRHNADGSQSAYELNVTYVDAITDPAESQDMQVRRFMVSQGIMLALAGVPAIYIHSLLGSHNDQGGVAATGHNRSINRARLDRPTLEAELADSSSFRSQIFSALTRLIALRRQQAAFHPNSAQQALDVHNPAVFALLRGTEEAGILALFNLSGKAQSIHTPQSGVDLISGESYSGQISLAPYQIIWLTLS